MEGNDLQLQTLQKELIIGEKQNNEER